MREAWDEVPDAPCGRPLRNAAKAFRQIASDFNEATVLRSGHTRAGAKSWAMVGSPACEVKAMPELLFLQLIARTDRYRYD
jgi:hypothetical protein